MLRLDAELNKDTISKLKKPLGKLYPHFEDAIEEIKSSEFLMRVRNLAVSVPSTSVNLLMITSPEALERNL